MVFGTITGILMHSQLFTCRFFINAGNNQFYTNIIILILNYRFN
ncbi:MAG: hypothetical protein GQF41_0174 [Candidatus Rifleibacterium amylolyticum]|nr:MAG: hypothetical protein GQF41_0174 [Candidatus Rifleibacterium amylolyticum]